MANTKISDLPEVTVLNNNLEFPLNDAGTTKKVSWGGLLGGISSSSVLETSSDYSFTKTDGITDVISNASAKQNIFTLPKLSENLGRKIVFNNLNDGITKIVNNAVDGAFTQYLIQADDNLEVIATTTKWVIKKITTRITSGEVDRSDSTNVHIGTVDIDYDNMSGSFDIGEIVTGSGGATGRIILDNNAGLTGTLVVIQCTGTGNFINNNTLTGSNSGATALVNEPSGTTKNLDSNFYHGLGIAYGEYTSRQIITFGGNTFEEADSNSDIGSGNTLGYTKYKVDTNNFKHQSGANGLYFIQDTGIGDDLTTDSIQYEVTMERKI
jgi:hypothetical protein